MTLGMENANDLCVEWRVVNRNGNYLVSSIGDIKSIDHVTTVSKNGKEFQVRRKGKMLAKVLHKGYFVTKLGKQKNLVGFHQIVAEAFLVRNNISDVVNHINGVKTDNRVANLEYITNSQNVEHAHATGLLLVKGESNGRAVLSESEVIRAREMFNNGASIRELANFLGVSTAHSRRIVKKAAWAHV